MSKYYNSRRSRGLYNPKTDKQFRISRSKIDLFLDCPRCFYLDRKLGVGRPPGFPFTLNNAVDALLKKEFNIYRIMKMPHPLMKKYGIDAVPFAHKEMDKWRDSLHGGVTYLHNTTNFFVTGGVDDIWINKENELIVADYKATSKNGEVNLDAEWQIGYKRQVEVYQWLLRKNGFNVSNITYFIYVNGDANKEGFYGKLEFDVKIIPYIGNASWIENTLIDMKKCLDADKIPDTSPDCDYCNYRESVKDVSEGLH